MFDDINWEDVWSALSYPFRNPDLPDANAWINSPDTPAWLQDGIPLVLGISPEQAKATGERVNRIVDVPIDAVKKGVEYFTETSQEKEGRLAASKGGEAERRMRAIRAQHTGPSYVKSLTPAEDAKPEEEPDEDDWMNQLLMSSLMAGGKATGRQAPSSYGVGAQVTPGNPWTMRADWEQDYRYLK